jgi:hypothetical protein
VSFETAPIKTDPDPKKLGSRIGLNNDDKSDRNLPNQNAPPRPDTMVLLGSPFAFCGFIDCDIETV